MVEVAEEFVEAVHGRQIFVAVAQMVLAELAGGISQRFEQLGDRGIFLLKSDIRTGHTDLRQARADWVLPADEAGSARGAALLRIIVGKGDAFFGDAVDIRRAVAHRATAKVADVPDADVVSPKDEDIWLLRGHESSFS